MYRFIEIEYTGSHDGHVFDTTDKKKAEEAGILNSHQPYGPAIVCLGEGHLLKGLEDAIEGKEQNKEFTVTLDPEQAFGKKNASLLKVVPRNVFKKQNIQVVTGLQVNIDGEVGIVRSAAGGRIIVDFNHPLAGRDVSYTATILRDVTDTVEQIKALFRVELHLTEITVSLNGKKATIATKHALPEQISTHVKERVCSLVEGVEDISFDVLKEKS